MPTEPRIKTFAACDGSGFATIFLDGRDRPAGVFHIHPPSVKSEADAVAAARSWWFTQQERMERRRENLPPPRAIPQQPVEDVFA
jgi:hypothetical protein